MAPARHISGTTTRLVLGHVRGRAGDDGVARLLARAGETRPAEELADEAGWSSYGQAMALLEAARDLLDDPDVGRKIGEDAMSYREGSPLLPLLQALGSPGAVARNVATASSKLQAVGDAAALEVDDEAAVVTFQNHDGFPRHRLHCDYMVGLLTAVPRVFGLPSAAVRHPECQVDGAARCLYRVSWRPGLDDGGRLDHLEDRLLLLAEQVEELQSSAADLVSADDVDTVLARIAARAGAAVRAPRHLLVVSPIGGAPRRVVAQGLDGEEAAALADELLAEDGAAADDPRRLVADVTSALRRYGRLAAVHVADGRFFPQEERLLAAYARHAAAALDVATALEEARRGEQQATLLVELAHGLARSSSVEEVCARLAEAVVELAGAPLSGVFLWDDDRSVLRLVATAGAGGNGRVAPDWEVRAGAMDALDRLLRTRGTQLLHLEGADGPLAERMRRLGIRTTVLVPIAGASRLWGAITASWVDGGPAELDAALDRRLSGLADQVATALHNVDLLEQVRHSALHDALTGLPNSVLFRDRLGRALAAIERDGGRLAVCFLDLDRFKVVNDALGHAAGDGLLRDVAARLSGTVRAVDTVARLAGDEFTILVPDVEGRTAVATVADKVLAAMRVPFTFSGVDVRVSPSIGIALAPDHGRDAELLLQRADSAMYRAKERGRGCWAVFGDGS